MDSWLRARFSSWATSRMATMSEVPQNCLGSCRLG